MSKEYAEEEENGDPEEEQQGFLEQEDTYNSQVIMSNKSSKRDEVIQPVAGRSQAQQGLGQNKTSSNNPSIRSYGSADMRAASQLPPINSRKSDSRQSGVSGSKRSVAGPPMSVKTDKKSAKVRFLEPVGGRDDRELANDDEEVFDVPAELMESDFATDRRTGTARAFAGGQGRFRGDDAGDAQAGDDYKSLPLTLPGQSNSLKKAKLAMKIKFKDEGEGSSNSKMGSYSEFGASNDNSEDKAKVGYRGLEERARAEHKRFYRIFRQVYKLQHDKAKGKPPKATDFLGAYLKGVKEADELRIKERKQKDQELFEMVRKVMEYQDARTQELMERLRVQELRRQELAEDKLGGVARMVLKDYKQSKEQKQAYLEQKQKRMALAETYMDKLRNYYQGKMPPPVDPNKLIEDFD